MKTAQELMKEYDEKVTNQALELDPFKVHSRQATIALIILELEGQKIEEIELDSLRKENLDCWLVLRDINTSLDQRINEWKKLL